MFDGIKRFFKEFAEDLFYEGPEVYGHPVEEKPYEPMWFPIIKKDMQDK